MEILEVLWYITLLGSIAAYAILDGFDLGVGALHLCTPHDIERRTFLSAIGPVWDGNEVWLIAVLGGMLAGFPDAYAGILSSFYIPIMFLLFGLIFRAVSIEFRSKLENSYWRRFWDCSFSIGSIVVILALGLIIGNFIEGIPVDSNGLFIPGIMMHIHPYSLLVSITTLALFCLHGCCFLQLKTDGNLARKVFNWGRVSFLFFFICYLAITLASITSAPQVVEKVIYRPELWILAVINFLVIIALGRSLLKRKAGLAFLFSSLNIFLLVTVYAFSSFPILLRASNDPKKSITIYNGSASTTTLVILLIVALTAIPLIVGYTIHVYKVFRGKVTEDSLIY